MTTWSCSLSQAKGNEPETIFATMSGTHVNSHCCFDCA